MIGKNVVINKEKWIARMKRHYNESHWFYKKILNCDSISDVLNLKESKIYKTCSSRSKSKKRTYWYKNEKRKRRNMNKKIDLSELE